MFPASHSSLNQLWARLLLEELVRRGVRHCCLAPGSRSTPLVLAAAGRRDLRLHHHLDERGLGFLALGLAKRSGEAVALITTSGTAVANLYPAVIEASLTGARLVLLTADRPPRLQDCGANQAIPQRFIFADYPRAVINLDPPTRALPAAGLLARLDAGLDAIAGPAGGVLHVNCRYDEPLYPDGAREAFDDYLAPLDAWCRGDAPYRRAPATAAAALPSAPAWDAFTAGPGLIVAGATADAGAAAAIKALARRLGWPLLADLQSPLKFDPQCLGLADLLLEQPAARERLAGRRRLLQFGGRLVSKRLQQFIEAQPWEAFWVVHPGDYPLAPGRNQSAFFAAEAGPWCAALEAPPAAAEDWALAALNARLVRALARRFDAPRALTELGVAYRLLAELPEASTLVAGNSLAIRLLDLVGGNLPSRPRLVANRGASGIEGLVATAAGCVLADGAPATLLLGDTSLLYDLNGLALLGALPAPLVVVVLNNDGGGIFRMLPVPDAALLEAHYQRPHGLGFEAACRLFELDHRLPATLPAFARDYRAAIAGGRSCVIEVRCDAADTAAEIRALGSWSREAVG